LSVVPNDGISPDYSLICHEMHHENISLRAGPTCKNPKSTILKTTENSSAGDRYKIFPDKKNKQIETISRVAQLTTNVVINVKKLPV